MNLQVLSQHTTASEKGQCACALLSKPFILLEQLGSDDFQTRGWIRKKGSGLFGSEPEGRQGEMVAQTLASRSRALLADF